MKLYEIYAARTAIGKLLKTNFRPGIAYRLMKFVKKLSVELEVVEEHRVSLLKTFAKPDDKGFVSLDQSSPEYLKFRDEYIEYLQTESEIETFGLPLSGMIDEIAGDQNFTVEELGLLEPLFQEG